MIDLVGKGHVSLWLVFSDPWLVFSDLWLV